MEFVNLINSQREEIEKLKEGLILRDQVIATLRKHNEILKEELLKVKKWWKFWK